MLTILTFLVTDCECYFIHHLHTARKFDKNASSVEIRLRQGLKFQREVVDGDVNQGSEAESITRRLRLKLRLETSLLYIVLVDSCSTQPKL